MGLMDYTAVELGKKIKAGEVSVLEAANAAMDAIDALEDKFNGTGKSSSAGKGRGTPEED